MDVILDAVYTVFNRHPKEHPNSKILVKFFDAIQKFDNWTSFDRQVHYSDREFKDLIFVA